MDQSACSQTLTSKHNWRELHIVCLYQGHDRNRIAVSHAAVKPAGQGDYKELKGLYDMDHCTNGLSVILPDNNIIRLVRIFAPYEALCNAFHKAYLGK